MRQMITVVATVLCAISAGADGGVPFSAIRLRKPQTDSAKVWQATRAQFAAALLRFANIAKTNAAPEKTPQ